MWKVSYFDEALEDLKKMDISQRKQVLKAIDKVKTNPLPQNEGGYGKPLGSKTGLFQSNAHHIVWMAEDMKKYQNSLETMSSEAVEYVRGVPVLKTFGQTIFSFKRFKAVEI